MIEYGELLTPPQSEEKGAKSDNEVREGLDDVGLDGETEKGEVKGETKQ